MSNGTPVDPCAAVQAQLDQANATIDVLNRTIRYMIQNYDALIPIVTPPAGLVSASPVGPGSPTADVAETLRGAAAAAGRRRST